MTYYLVKFWVQRLSNPKKHGRNKGRVFLDIFSPSENNSGVHLPIKNIFLVLESWWTFAVHNCRISVYLRTPWVSLGHQVKSLVYLDNSIWLSPFFSFIVLNKGSLDAHSGWNSSLGSQRDHLRPLDRRKERGVGQGCYPYKYECNSKHEYFEGVDKR